MIDGWATVLPHLQAVVLVVGYRRRHVRRELQRQMSGVGVLRALHEHHRRLRLSL